MKIKILLPSLLVLFAWTMSANAQTLRFIPDTSNKSILVYKTLHSKDTLVFVKKIVVPTSIAKLIIIDSLVCRMNLKENDSFVYQEKQVDKHLIQNKKVFFLLPTLRWTEEIKGFYFSLDELNFKFFEYRREDVGLNFKNNIILENLGILTILSFLIPFMVLSFLIFRNRFKSRIIKFIFVYLVPLVIAWFFFSFAFTSFLFNYHVLIYMIVPSLFGSYFASIIIRGREKFYLKLEKEEDEEEDEEEENSGNKKKDEENCKGK